jgi:hypothetical protein
VKSGVHSVSNKKLLNGISAKKPHDSETKTQMIPIVVRIVISPLKASPYSITFSPDLFTIFFKALMIQPQ